MMSPMTWSELAEIVATCAICSRESTSRGHVLQTFAEDGFGEDRRGGGTVTGVVGRLGSDFLDHLRAHVLKGVRQLDFLRDGHTVLRDGGGTELLVDDDIAAFRAERRLDGLGQSGNTGQQGLTAFRIVLNLFSSHGNYSYL